MLGVAGVLLDSPYRRKGARLHGIKVENFGSVLNVYPNDVTIGVQVDNNTILNLARIDAGPRGKIDIERIRFLVVLKLHHYLVLENR